MQKVITVQQIGVVGLRTESGDFLPPEPIYINANSPNIAALNAIEKRASNNLAKEIIKQQKQKEQANESYCSSSKA